MDQEKNEKREEKREQAAKPKTAKPSRLGREAKIGVTVLVLLLVGLGVAVAMRLTRSTAPDSQVATNADAGKAKSDSTKNDKLFGDYKRRPTTSPTTVTPTRSVVSKPPKTYDGDNWSTASDKPEPKRKRDLTASLPPTTVPDPPKTVTKSRYESDAAATSSVEDTGKSSKRHEGSRYDRSKALPPPTLPPLTTPPLTAPPSTSPPTEPPKSRYSDITDRPVSAPSAPPPTTLPPPPATLPPPAKTVSRYGDSDDRRSESGSRRSDSEYRGGDNPYRRGDNESRSGDNSYRTADADRHYNPAREVERPRRSSAAPSYSPNGKTEVQPNDSYWTISERVYGSGSYFKALSEHNRKQGNDDRLKPGDFVWTPSMAELEKSYPDLCPKASRRETMQSREVAVSSHRTYRSGHIYTVAEGDTLFTIARYELGKASRWVEIYELNRDLLGKDFNYITPGTQLTIPDGDNSNTDKPDTLASPPGGGYRR